MAGYVMKMSILVPNINRRGQKDLSFKVRHKAYACPLAQIINTTQNGSKSRFDKLFYQEYSRFQYENLWQ